MEQIKLGYFTEGFDKYQAPIKRYIALAEHHDKERFEVKFYSRLGPEDAKVQRQAYEETIEHLKSLGHSVTILPLKQLMSQMIKDNLDIVASHAIMCIPGFFQELKDCGSKIVSFSLQQPTNDPLPDITIHHSPTTLGHESSDATLIKSRYIKSRLTREEPYKKSDFGLPEDCILLISTGRPIMFQSEQYWKAILSILNSTHNVYLMAIGCNHPNGHAKILSMGFKTDVFDLLQIGDIYLDTFPLGGGWSLAEAIFAGLPCVTFEANLQPFDFMQATLPEILSIPELTIRRWWMGNWVTLVRRLISSASYRNVMAEKVKERAKILGDYESYIRQVEKVYINLMDDRVSAGLIPAGGLGNHPLGVPERRI